MVPGGNKVKRLSLVSHTTKTIHHHHHHHQIISCIVFYIMSYIIQIEGKQEVGGDLGFCVLKLQII